ncbi:MAG TPA: exodeoxyribonuclease VII large subunit [Cyclobacteriaceae bacterium]
MQSPQGHIRLSELNQKIGSALNNAFSEASFWVVADVTSHTFREEKSYHSFELVEKDPFSNRVIAQVRAKAWGFGSDRIEQFERQTGQRFTNNINVLVNVSVEYHPAYGLQVNLLDIDPAFTLGVLEQQRLAVLEDLISKNAEFIRKVGDRYFTRNNQLKLGAVIQKIAIISSKTSAGAEDFLHTLNNNPHGYKFSIDNYYTAMQGESNADQFVAKIIEVYNSGRQYDAVVITRGGGAQTDFLIFDNYHIGRAIARFPVPVITGIGHQKNETIADLMAHTSTKTPTKAAEFIIEHNRRYEDALVSLQRMIVIKSQQIFSNSFRALAANNLDIINSTRNILSHHKDNLTSIRKSTVVHLRSMLQLQQRSLEHFSSLVRVARPDSILKRGFAIVKSGNRIVTNTDDIEVGSKLDIILSGSVLNTTVNQKTKRDGAGSDL